MSALGGSPGAVPAFTITDASASHIYLSSPPEGDIWSRWTQQQRQRDIDWTKVRTVEDVVAILRALRITVADPSSQADALRAYLAP